MHSVHRFFVSYKIKQYENFHSISMLVVSLLGRNWFNTVLREFPLAWVRRGRRTCTIVCFVQFTNSCLRVCYHQVMLFRLYVSSLFRCKDKPFLAIAQLFLPFFLYAGAKKSRLVAISVVILLIFQGFSVKKNFIATPSVMGETIARVRAYILYKV